MKNRLFDRKGLITGLFLAAIAASTMGLMEQKFGAVRGRVVGPDGQPVDNAFVRVVISGPTRGSANTDGASRGKSADFQTDPGPIMLGKGQSLVASGKTDATGNFEIKKVPVGKYKVVTNLTARFKAASVDVEVSENQSANVDIKLEAR